MNPSTELARRIVASLVAHGVSEVVLAPGSRNAPLAFGREGPFRHALALTAAVPWPQRHQHPRGRAWISQRNSASANESGSYGSPEACPALRSPSSAGVASTG